MLSISIDLFYKFFGEIQIPLRYVAHVTKGYGLHESNKCLFAYICCGFDPFWFNRVLFPTPVCRIWKAQMLTLEVCLDNCKFLVVQVTSIILLLIY